MSAEVEDLRDAVRSEARKVTNLVSRLASDLFAEALDQATLERLLCDLVHVQPTLQRISVQLAPSLTERVESMTPAQFNAWLDQEG